MVPAEHIAGAFEQLLQAMVDQAADRLAERLEGQLRPQAPADLPSLGLQPLKTYTAKEAADFLGIDRLASVYEIPEYELRRVKRVGSSIGYLGLDLMCYKLGLPCIDLEGMIEQYREKLLADRPAAVRPLHPDAPGKTRVL